MSDILLIIRFASSLPDLSLPIASPATLSIYGLKRLIRTHLPVESKRNAMRLIFAGRVLADRTSIATAIGHVIKRGNEEDDNIGNVGKGKSRAAPAPTVYLHCAVSSNELPTEDLKIEEKYASIDTERSQSKASIYPAKSSRGQQSNNSTGAANAALNDAQTQGTSPQHDTHTPSTIPQQRGFDRLGFSAEDVASLRAQHRSLISARYTADTMPDEDTLYEMEERWLENQSGNSAGTGVDLPDGTGLGAAGMEDDHWASLMDTLYGTTIGFFWPIGCVVWGLQEEGVWSARRRQAILAGLVLNAGFALMRIASWS